MGSSQLLMTNGKNPRYYEELRGQELMFWPLNPHKNFKKYVKIQLLLWGNQNYAQKCFSTPQWDFGYKLSSWSITQNFCDTHNYQTKNHLQAGSISDVKLNSPRCHLQTRHHSPTSTKFSKLASHRSGQGKPVSQIMIIMIMASGGSQLPWKYSKWEWA